MRTLPPRQFGALQILAGAGRLTVTVLSHHMRCDAGTTKNALRLLGAKGLAEADEGTWPATWAITPEGRAALAAELKPEA